MEGRLKATRMSNSPPKNMNSIVALVPLILIAILN